MLTMGYLGAGGCLFGQTHQYRACFSGIYSLGFPLLPSNPHHHPKCANLLFREFLSGRIWSLTIHRNDNKAPLLIFWGSDPVLICSTGGVTAIHRFRNTTLNSNKQWIRSIITPETFPAQTSDVWWWIAEFHLKPGKPSMIFATYLERKTIAGTWGNQPDWERCYMCVWVSLKEEERNRIWGEAVSDRRRDKR